MESNHWPNSHFVHNYICEAGKYCLGNDENGIPIPPISCEAGTYLNKRGAKSDSECKVCPGGSRCNKGATNPTACLEGTYCPPGSLDIINCTEGYFCSHKSIEPVICPEAFFCPMNSAYPMKCGNGYYCDKGTVEPTICPAGTIGTNNPHNVNG